MIECTECGKAQTEQDYFEDFPNCVWCTNVMLARYDGDGVPPAPMLWALRIWTQCLLAVFAAKRLSMTNTS